MKLPILTIKYIKKEKSKIVLIFNFKNIPVLNTVPILLIPGTNAIDCAIPSFKESILVIESIEHLGKFSDDKNNKIVVMSKVIPINLELIEICSILSLNSMPIIIQGIDAIINLVIKLGFFKITFK